MHSGTNKRTLLILRKIGRKTEKKKKLTNTSSAVYHLDRGSRRRTYIRKMDNGDIDRQNGS